MGGVNVAGVDMEEVDWQVYDVSVLGRDEGCTVKYNPLPEGVPESTDRTRVDMSGVDIIGTERAGVCQVYILKRMADS